MPISLRASFLLPTFVALAMLIAAGLLIVSAPGVVHALGADDEGICDYSETMRDALLEHRDFEFFQCDESPFASTGAADAWGGNLGDLAVDVGTTGRFAPGKGELDGYAPGSRVDLRGSGLGVEDLDVSAALESLESSPAYRRFGEDAAGTDYDSRNSDGIAGLTFLLDGGLASTGGLASSTYSATEGEIAWITFQMSEIPREFSNWSSTDESDVTGEDDGFHLVLKLHVEIDGNEKQVFFLVNSEDSLRTLYAIPFRVPDDEVIERPERADVNLSAVGVFDKRSQFDPDVPEQPNYGDSQFTNDEEDKFEVIVRSMSRNDDARLTINDDDAPAIEVCDRSRPVRDELVNAVAGGKDCDEISAHDLAGLSTLDLSDSDIDSLQAGDFSGLTTVTELDLTGNDLASLPTGAFEGLGSDLDAPNVALIDVSDNPGPRNRGFSRSNVSSSFQASIGPRQAVRLASHEFISDPDYGLDRATYSAGEGQTLVLGLSALPNDSAVIFRSLAGDSGGLRDPDDCADPCPIPGSAQIESDGEYLLGFAIPADANNRSDTYTILYGESSVATSLNTVQSIARLTVTEDGSGTGPGPTTPPSIFESVRVVDTISVAAPGNPDLVHNISDLQVTVGGRTLPANFLEYHNRTGQRERWGYPTSEVLEIEPGTLTQFFQRGVIDFHDVGAGWIVERRLAWDYFGGGLGGSRDQGFEPSPAAAPGTGAAYFPAFGHYVSDTAADGSRTGFLGFFNRLGGVDSFGFPKTEARRGTNAPGMLTEGKTPGFVRQYFQAAIFQLDANGNPQLTLLGDSLRNLLLPDHADYAAFRRAAPFADEQIIVPQRIV